MISYAQKLRNEGIDKGRDLGRDEGLLEGQRTMLLQLLTTRFTSVPEHIEARVASATLAELQRWAVRILDARSLDDIFAQDGREADWEEVWANNTEDAASPSSSPLGRRRPSRAHRGR